MPNLENLRKQAKLYLHWHRDRYYPVAAQIRQFVARFRDCSDRDILGQPFRLADAQELVARKAGFENWQALKRGLTTMSTAKPAVVPTTLLAAEPLLFVADVKTSCDFFTRRLGFEIAFVYGDPAFYGQVVRDGARLNLRKVCRRPFDADFLTQEQDVLSACISLDDAKPLFLEYQAAGVTFHQSLGTEPWGARSFIVTDPDGNLIGFFGKA
jgi:catechol 2,3-dioxygenase-like lactoylglutathione lyase family enzyme